MGVLQSPWLRVREVNISGMEQAEASRLSEAIMSLLGKPILSLAPFRVAHFIESEPLVRAVQVRLKLPGTVKFVVLEEEPVFWVKSRGKGLALSADGMAIKWTKDTRGLCQLLGVTPPIRPGDVVRGEEFVALRLLYFALRRAGVKGVKAVGADWEGTLFACFKNGTVITFGEPTQLRVKVERTRALLHFLGSRKARVDLLSPDFAIWKPVKGVEGG